MRENYAKMKFRYIHKSLILFVIDRSEWRSHRLRQMTGFSDVGATGTVKPPFVWNADDRVHRMARLDALFMHLYGLSEADADIILPTFPIVREKDQAAFGTSRARDWILAYRQRIDGGNLSHHNLDAPALQ